MPETVSQARSVDDCKYRTDPLVDERGRERANCGLLGALTGRGNGAEAVVGRDACEACCRSFPPTPGSINPVLASLLLQRADAEPDPARASALKARAVNALTITGEPPTLRRWFPAPRRSLDDRVKTWAVGVTTAPRRQPTLDRCLDSLEAAGWSNPHLFIDSEVLLSDRASALPYTYRDVRLGAWPSYMLALHELLMRRPRADAYMLVQDDALFYHREPLREYLETDVLWPDQGHDAGRGIVSLYCSSAYMQARAGWHPTATRWGWGALAFIFPNALAREFVIDRRVFDHRWVGRSDGLAHIDVVIGYWVIRRQVTLWHPSPSLVQHIGDTSSLWSKTLNIGDRRANWFAGDPLV